MTSTDQHFAPFGVRAIGNDARIATPYGDRLLLYADWAASGRLYGPIEQKITEVFGPLVANTHTESSATGQAMTHAYHEAREIIKSHVGASPDDLLFTAGSGMTGAVTLLQRLLGWRVPEQYSEGIRIGITDRPVVFVSELEHHSNHTSWLETIADVVVVSSTDTEPFDMHALDFLLTKYRHRKHKVAAVTAASNVTGVRLPIHNIAARMHQAGGLCFVDYTCAAPYDAINMHPEDDGESLDAIYFSPHKFLGGPGSPGILVCSRTLCKNQVPDRPGGGTVAWTNPWGGRRYSEDIEMREDGGTPPFLGVIRAALAIKLKEQMGIQQIAQRESQIVAQMFDGLQHTKGVRLLAPSMKDRVTVFALVFDAVHYNLATRLLSDKFGIQARGGCACAGTYGHRLFGISRHKSAEITDKIDAGDLSAKPGFVRVSLHPIMPQDKVAYVISALKNIAAHGKEWARDYTYDPRTNEFTHKAGQTPALDIETAFSL